eukprot:TRINITY_DN5178_c0_g1_i1.p1 TRINITY_DN5178_c0_g1~~TRINITY_DN5178_c0_g1_i1.p1  ORF type:complete len:2069 (+),score=485.17 TRINITY_DN5178_c0_g1_i1:69-6209(+)
MGSLGRGSAPSPPLPSPAQPSDGGGDSPLPPSPPPPPSPPSGPGPPPPTSGPAPQTPSPPPERAGGGGAPALLPPSEGSLSCAAHPATPSSIGLQRQPRSAAALAASTATPPAALAEWPKRTSIASSGSVENDSGLSGLRDAGKSALRGLGLMRRRSSDKRYDVRKLSTILGDPSLPSDARQRLLDARRASHSEEMLAATELVLEDPTLPADLRRRLEEAVPAAVGLPNGDTCQLSTDGVTLPVPLGQPLHPPPGPLGHTAEPTREAPPLPTTAAAAEEPVGEITDTPLEEDARRHGPQGYSWGVLSPENPFRRFVYRCIFSTVVSNILTLLIVANTATMLAVDPQEMNGDKPQSSTTKGFILLDSVATCVFLAEYVLKMTALGVWNGRHTLFGRPAGKWFLADLLTVLVSFVFLVAGTGRSGMVMLRAFRAVRPLRSLRAFGGIKAILDSLLRALPLLSDSVALLCFLLFLYGVIGLEFYAGILLRRCAICRGPGCGRFSADAAGAAQRQNQTWEEASPPIYCGRADGGEGRGCPDGMTCREHGSNIFPFMQANFDNIASAALTIFHVSTLANWSDLMYVYMDADQPVVAVVYFWSMVMLISFIVINLFIAVINTVFSQIRAEQQGQQALSGAGLGQNKMAQALMYFGSKVQRAASVFQEGVAPVMAATGGCVDEKTGFRGTIANMRRRIHALVWSQPFEILVYTAIMVNIGLQASQYRGMSAEHENVLSVSEHVFAAVFLAEALLRLASYDRVRDYVSEPWNVFDAVLVILSYVSLYAMSTNVSFLRSFRVFRIVRLLRSHHTRGLKELIENALQSIGGVANLAIFVAFSLVIFAGMGKQMMGGKLTDQHRQQFRHSFDTLGDALVTLFVIMTGDSWFLSMYHLMDPETGVGVWVFAYYISFYIWAVWVLLSLFTAVILENFAHPEDSRVEEYEELQDKRWRNMMDLKDPAGQRQVPLPPPTKTKELESAFDTDDVVHEPRSAAMVQPLDAAFVGLCDEDQYAAEGGEAPEPPASTACLARGPREGALQGKSQSSPPRRRSASDPPPPPLPGACDWQPSGAEARDSLSPDTAKRYGGAVVSPAAPHVGRFRRYSRASRNSHASLAMSREVSPRVQRMLEEENDFFDSALLSSDLMRGRDAAQDEAQFMSQLGLSGELTTSVIPLEAYVEWLEECAPPRTRAGDRLGLSAATIVAVARKAGSMHSLYIFAPTNPFRRLCKAIVDHRWFEGFIGVLILMLIAMMAVSVTIDPAEAIRAQETETEVIKVVDYCLSVVFGVECLLKIVAHGFWDPPDTAYLRSAWNRLDFLLVLLMFVAPSAKGFRVIRSLRPLRLVNKTQRMKVIMSALWKSVPTMINVSITSVFVIFIFGLMGLEIFSAKMDYCTDSPQNRAGCVGNFVNGKGVLTPRKWQTPDLNFDDLPSATFTLVQVASLNSWSATMYRAMDITQENEAPKRNASAMSALFFVAFVLVGTFFIINLFIGVIIVSIQREGNVDMLTDDQRNWVELRQQLQQIKPLLHRKRPQGKSAVQRLRRLSFDIVESVPFALVIAASIFANMIIAGMYHHNQPDSLESTADVSGFVFLSIFLAEAGLKLGAYGRRVYFDSSWNTLDFGLVMGNLLMTVLLSSSAQMKGVTFLVYLQRLFRIGRMLRLVKRTKGVRFLLGTLLRSMGSVLNALLLLALLLIIYGLTGAVLFANVRYQTALHRHANYRSFLSAFLVMFRFITLDGWSDMMWELKVQPPFCTRNDVMDDCGPSWPGVVEIYFLSFFILGSCVVYNLLIGIVIDEFAICYSTRYFSIKPPHIEDYVRSWQVEDVDNRGALPRWRVLRLVKDLHRKGNALGVSPRTTQHQLLLYHVEMLELHASGQAIDEEGESALSKLQVCTGKRCSVDAPLRFVTVLLLLAKLQVPDSALTDQEYVLREKLKHRAELHFAQEKIKGMLRGFITKRRMQRLAGPKAELLGNLRRHLAEAVHAHRDQTGEKTPEGSLSPATQGPQVPPSPGGREDTFDPDSILYGAERQESTLPGLGMDWLRRRRFVIMMLRTVND